jgi:hypothetical protein
MKYEVPTEEEKRAIHDPSDLPIIALIKGLSEEERKLIYNSIKIKFCYQSDFEERQMPWIGDFKHYWKENNHKDPEVDTGEFSTAFLQSHEYERFRLYYAAKYPDRVIIDKPQNVRALEFMIETNNAIEVSKLISALPNKK